jgi:phosphoglycerate dehydrogenase-like enzyme
MAKIVVVHPLNDQQIAKIQQVAPGWDIIVEDPAALKEDQLLNAEIIMGWNKMVEANVHSSNSLRWLQIFGAGVDGLPLNSFIQKNILLTNASGVHPYPISETIFGMLLSFTRGLHISCRDQLNQKWGNTSVLGELHGQTIGLLGVGAIGTETAKIAKAFGMTVLGIRRGGKESEWVDQMFNIDGLDKVLAASDYIVNCLPLTNETEHLIGKNQFASMKSTAFYINIGRGRTTDTNALVEAIQLGVIGGAGLDVFEQEPLPADHPLWTLDNVILTPHQAGNTPHYFDRVIEIFVTNLANYVQNKSLSVNFVDLTRQY